MKYRGVRDGEPMKGAGKLDRNEKTDIMMALLRSGIVGTEVPEGVTQALGREDVESMLSLCEGYDVSEALFAALLECGAVRRGDGLYEALAEVQERDFFRCKRLEHTLAEIRRALTEAQIEFVPLKGAVMRTLYPSPMLRMSADVDVLVRECDLDRACRALEGVGFGIDGKRGFHDISLYSPDGMHLELHDNIKEMTRGLTPPWSEPATISHTPLRASVSVALLPSSLPSTS